MSSTTLTSRPTEAHAPATRDDVTPVRVLTSEWIKLRTLRSSWYTLAAAVVAMIAIGLVIGYATSTSNWASLDAEDTVASAPLQGYHLSELLIGVLGVLFVSGEYATGMIRSTFAAVPKRLPILGAKSAVFGVVALVTMTATSFATFFAAQAFLSPDGHGSSLSDPGALRSVAGVGFYLALIGLLGGAFGWIVRSTAGAISGLVGLLLIVPVILGLLPGSIGTTIAKFFPSNAGGSLVSSVQLPDTLAPWTGIGVLGLWVVAALALAAVVIRRRDA
jgi:ABC-2 type transport system permease protein